MCRPSYLSLAFFASHENTVLVHNIPHPHADFQQIRQREGARASSYSRERASVRVHATAHHVLLAQHIQVDATLTHSLPAFSQYAVYSNRWQQNSERSRHLLYPTIHHHASALANNSPFQAKESRRMAHVVRVVKVVLTLQDVET